MTFSDLLRSTADFSENLQHQLAIARMLDICRQLEMDHICVRLSDSAAVQTLHTQLKNAGETISSAVVSGREIYIVQLRTPLTIGPWKTQGIEQPHPKPGHLYGDGWEHVEFVMPSAEPTVDGVADAFNALFPHIKNYEVREPHVEGDQLPNPTVDLVLDSMGVKFHAHSIQTVVGHQIVR